MDTQNLNKKDINDECKTLSLNDEKECRTGAFDNEKSDRINDLNVIGCCHISVDDMNNPDITINELVYEWLSSISPCVKESTLSNYRMKAEKHILPVLGEIQCHALKTKDIYYFIEDKQRSGLSSGYISDLLVMLKSVLKYAGREYGIKNILDGFIMPKRSRPDVKILSEKEQSVLEKYIYENNDLTTLGISLSLYMGLRIGEICALKWNDIDFDKHILSVRHTIQRIQTENATEKTKLVISDPKSTSSKREIPIPDCVMEMLVKMRDSDEFFVLSGSYQPTEPRTMQYRFTKILKKIGLSPVHFHSLRHLFATNCIILGFDIKTLSELLGHSSIEITLNRYVHSSMERKRACMNLVNAVSDHG